MLMSSDLTIAQFFCDVARVCDAYHALKIRPILSVSSQAKADCLSDSACHVSVAARYEVSVLSTIDWLRGVGSLVPECQVK